MRTLAKIACLAPAAVLFACDQQGTATDVDPMLGRECFESHRASLPPGAQYEGIEKYTGDMLTIRVMNGVEVVTLDCGSSPDGVSGGAEK